MTPEEKSLLERTLKVSQENNAILRGLRRSNRVSTIMQILYWSIIILLSVGAFYFIQPYINIAASLLGGISTGTAGTSTTAATMPSQSSIENAATSLKQLLQGSP